MTIEKELNGTELKVKVAGRLDSTTSKEFSQEMDRSLKDVQSVVFDFSDLEYISSAGLRAMLVVRRCVGGEAPVRVQNANELVKEVFSVTNLNDLVTIE